MSPEDRHVESILLSERKSLIENGSVADKSSIKIRGPRLFIGQKLHGKVINGIFHPSNLLGDYAPNLLQLHGRRQVLLFEGAGVKFVNDF